MSRPRSFSLSRNARAVAVPIGAAALVLAGAVGLGGVHADSAFASQHPRLPAMSPVQLLTAVQTSKTEALSGTIVESAHWGLPSLPGGVDNASLSWQGLLTGSHTVRVAVSGPGQARLAVLGSLSESDVVRNGNDVWTYTSSTNSVTHTVLTDRSATTPDDPAPAARLTPEGAARQLLAAVTPSTVVSVDPTQRVAGRSAYTLVLTPRDSRTTVDKIEIALDSKQFVPLRVRLFGSGSTTPAFSTAFTSISFRTPPASTFHFTPPAGASTERDPFGLALLTPGSKTPGSQVDSAANSVRVLGSGWTSVLAIPAAATAAPLAPPPGRADTERVAAPSPLALLRNLTSPFGNDGSRLLHTTVLNVLITADGRIFAGAVSPALLQDAAAGTYQ
jgi:outer membrane lipoprotein-sorting protein